MHALLPRRVPAVAAAAILLGLVPTARAQVTVSVDVNAARKAISPLIYGVHFADSATLLDLNATVNRHGGNSVGRYNWQQDIDNRGSDYFFRAFPYYGGPGGLGDNFIEATRAGGAEPFLSMPMVGWVAKTSPAGGETWSFSVAAYGPFTNALGDAGNGCKPGGPLDNFHPCGGALQGGSAFPFTGNDPNDSSIPADAVFQQGWVQHIKDKYGAGNAGGLRYWGLDNEASIWHTVYWDVHPQGATAAEMRDKMLDYGARIKAVDPTAQVLGPEEWGWDGYFYSGYDQQRWSRNLCAGWNCPDRVAIGGEYVPWLLAEMKKHETNTGTRVLDMLTLHVYPQGGEVDNGGGDVSPAMQQKRNRSTRALWDVNYVDESWIGTQVKLIPRMREWVASSYPGTALGLTEYDWGAEGHINGATAEADLLGIFGREGLNMAIRWVVPAANSPVYNAFKMYRNYDGSKSSFGETSVATTVPNPDRLAAFAAQRATGALTVMVVNKEAATPVTVNLANFTASGPAQAWQLTAANTIQRLADVAVAGNALTTTVPAQSVTLFVVFPGTPPPPPPTVDSSVVFRLRHPDIGAYLFTLYASERDSAVSTYGYIYEGTCCNWFTAPASDGRAELYRLYSGTAGEYFFTIYASERDAAVAQFGYLYEGVAAYCNPTATSAAPQEWYRLRYGNKHFYTVYVSERDAAVSQYGYVYEGVSCYLPPP